MRNDNDECFEFLTEDEQPKESQVELGTEFGDSTCNADMKQNFFFFCTELQIIAWLSYVTMMGLEHFVPFDMYNCNINPPSHR